MNTIDQARIRREALRWLIILTLNNARPIGSFEGPVLFVAQAEYPDATLMAFLQSTYDAAADRANWNRAALECGIGRPDKPRPVWPPA